MALLLPHSTCLHQPDDLSLGDDGVEQVQASIFPLHRAVNIQSVAQPEVGGASAREVQSQPSSATWTCPSALWQPPDAAPQVYLSPGSCHAQCSPGLELFGAEGVCDVLNRVTEAVCVVVRGVDAPASQTWSAQARAQCCSTPDTSSLPGNSEPFPPHVPGHGRASLPLVPSAMVWRELDTVGNGIHLPILHHQLHPQRGFPLPKLALSHVL